MFAMIRRPGGILAWCNTGLWHSGNTADSLVHAICRFDVVCTCTAEAVSASASKPSCVTKNQTVIGLSSDQPRLIWPCLLWQKAIITELQKTCLLCSRSCSCSVPRAVCTVQRKQFPTVRQKLGCTVRQNSFVLCVAAGISSRLMLLRMTLAYAQYSLNPVECAQPICVAETEPFLCPVHP